MWIGAYELQVYKFITQSSVLICEPHSVNSKVFGLGGGA